MVLYHAISSYQILEAMIHRKLYHPEEKAFLVLPDFVVNKLPQYQQLKKMGFFDELSLFPYRQIRHDAKTLMQQVEDAYEKNIPYPITAFHTVYLAAAHFYFSLYLLMKEIPFHYFEDGCGILSRPEISFDLVNSHTPFQAEWAQEHGLFDGMNPLIQTRICNLDAQTAEIPGDRQNVVHFDVAYALEGLPETFREKIITFFGAPEGLDAGENSMLVMTQQLANLGRISIQEQMLLYQMTLDYYAQGYRLVFKPHPDDVLYYDRLFPGSLVIREKFPAELLPYLLKTRPKAALVQYSSALAGVRKCFPINIFCGYGIEDHFWKLHLYDAGLRLAGKLGIKKIVGLGLFAPQIENLLQYGGLSDFGLEVCFAQKFAPSEADGFYLIDDPGGLEGFSYEKMEEWLSAAPEKAVFLFLNTQQDYLFYQPDHPDWADNTIPLPIRMQRQEDCLFKRQGEALWLLTKDKDFQNAARRVTMEKELPYTGMTWEIGPMDDVALKIAVLEGEIAAMEHRLKHYIQENRELKEQLEGQEERGHF